MMEKQTLPFVPLVPALAARVDAMLKAYDIHVCKASEIAAYQAFIRRDWKEGHLYGTSKALLDWQHFDANARCYNIVLALHKPSGDLHATLAFIPTRQFDPALPNYDVWLGLIKIREDVKASGLGQPLVRTLTELKGARSAGALGLTRAGFRGMQRLGFHMGTMNHYYMVNRTMTSFTLLGGYGGRAVAEEAEPTRGHKLECFEEQDVTGTKAVLGEFSNTVPQKSLSYLCRRYLRHPFYTYLCYGVFEHERIRGILILRKAGFENGTALRVIDFYGNVEGLRGMAAPFQELLRQHGSEYLDFYNAGIDPGIMRAAGFLLRTDGDAIVVPNYYEPFEKRNVDIEYGWIAAEETPYMIYKGDSDQDRPSRLDG